MFERWRDGYLELFERLKDKYSGDRKEWMSETRD